MCVLLFVCVCVFEAGGVVGWLPPVPSERVFDDSQAVLLMETSSGKSWGHVKAHARQRGWGIPLQE